MMLHLPAALAPWAPLLSIFPDEIALSLAPCLQKLAIGIGPMRGHGAQPRREPTGYDGLAQRGNYDRLLASEWLLSTEMPDEFIRRAAMNEHLFFKLGTHDQTMAHRCVVLFDEGPSQLGSPRIAHIALFIVMARRAQAADADFHWGILQTPDGLVKPAIEDGIRGLLHARTALEPTDEHARLWRSALGPGNTIEERWVIGGDQAARMGCDLGATAIGVEDVVEPGVRQVLVRVTPAGDSTADIRLDLPDPPTCVRLLRDPFSTAAVRPQWIPGRVSPNPRLVFGQYGRRIAIILSRDRVLARPLPNSPRAPVAPGFQFAVPKERYLAAVGWTIEGKLNVVTGQDDKSMMVDELGPRGGLARRHTFKDKKMIPFERPAVDDPVSACVRVRRSDGDVFVLGDSTGCLFLLGQTGDDSWEMDEKVTAFSAIGNRVAYVTQGYSVYPPILTVITATGSTDHGLEVPSEANLEAFFGFGGSHPEVGLVAIHKGLGRWVVFSGNTQELCPAEGDTVFGVMCPPGYDGGPALLVRGADQRSLSLIGLRFSFSLPRSVDPIIYACASQCSPHIGYVTSSGEVVVYSLRYKNNVLHLIPTGET
jgi:hypothetical protein